jgi:hypothetical protein
LSEIVLPTELPGQDSEAQRVGADGRVVIMRSFGRRKGIGKASNDGVFDLFCNKSRRISDVARQALRGDLEAISTIVGFSRVLILCLDGKGDVEMEERQRDGIFGRVVGEFRLFPPTLANRRKLDRAEPDDMILGVLRV